ncbi:hypothetical protein [Halobacillus karajensis]|uniref:Murein peptide carboxypeptidase n=1 Tax=Halobacillus karajensis TaxID=195088 RepID=A0A024P2B2_9BACI|nr:putative murein peptide carboxypeptidase [Halobacillus karajensis]CDQ22414.1 putative murein peptide carboxypeptidase [Halobacillus karajensis]CDQ28257.1 putative murein peptide carboxypeptidase [Halobacillus karajensis]
MIRPKRLQKGDTVGVVAPASPPDLKHLHQAIPFLNQQLGLQVKIGAHVTRPVCWRIAVCKKVISLYPQKTFGFSLMME